MQTIHFLRPAIGTAVILLIPLFGNLYVEGWDWSSFDFLIMGALIYLAGLSYEFLARKVSSTTSRVLIGIGVFLVLATIWAQLAVGAVSQAINTLTTFL